MGRLKLAGPMVVAVLLFGALPAPAFGFTGFSNMQADATFGEQMTFSVELTGGEPDELELLMQFAGSDSTLVAPVQPDGDQATYVWDAADRYVVPNTEIDYQWRATEDGRTTLSAEESLLYDDDRPGLDWQAAVIGEATVHWYGGNEQVARHLGELTAGGAAQAEDLLGHEMDGAVDIFIYDAREDFFGALGPGAREWFGAATFPPLRTIFMWLGAGPASYLETTVVHEVTHVVFQDATVNAFHDPAKWLNEGLATWAEQRAADVQQSTVESEASRGGLLSFDAIAYDFPFGTRGATLSYAMGTTMVDMIIDRYGEDAIARIAEAYRTGSSDDEALEEGTGVPADQLYADYYDSFGVDEPDPVEAAAIPPSDVDKPGGAQAPGASADESRAGSSEEPAPSETIMDPPIVVVVAVAGLAILGIAGFAAWSARRRGRDGEPS
ncbi:MAG TPA: peptidase MA family metallohydrolase [Candidatus Limnocylindria bacterium]